SRPIYPPCGVRSCGKSAQDIVQRPWVNRAIGTIELRKERISPGRAVVVGECATTADGRKFSVLSRNVPAPGQTDRRRARGAQSSLVWASRGTARDRSKTPPGRHPEGMNCIS